MRSPAASALRDPGWGLPYGGRPYRTDRGVLVWMWRKGHTTRWYSASGRQVGQEQSNVAPALAYALSRGWREADGMAPNAMTYFGVPPSWTGSRELTDRERLVGSNLPRRTGRKHRR